MILIPEADSLLFRTIAQTHKGTADDRGSKPVAG
jgi:hypothetical protein